MLDGRKIVSHFKHSDLSTNALLEQQRKIIPTIKPRKLIQDIATVGDSIYMSEALIFTAKLSGSVYFSPALQPHFMCVELKATVLVWRCKLLG